MEAVDVAGGPTEEILGAIPVPAAPEALVTATEELIATALLLGMDHASGALDLADDLTPITFEEAATFLKGRVPLTKREWNELEPKLRFRAFTIAALSTPDAVERVRRQAISAIETGKPLAEFWTAAKAESASGLGDSPWYWETVYRTNIQTAYNAGRAIEFARNQPEYIEFVGIEDDRQTEICRPRSGITLPATHPFWKVSWPPLHFKCRSTVRGVYREEVEALREADPEWRSTEDGLIPAGGVAKGFGGNPGDTGAYWEMTEGMAARARKFGLMPEIEATAKRFGLNGVRLWNDPADASSFEELVSIPRSGGKVLIHKKYKNAQLKELAIAERIAAEGKVVKLLPKSETLKSPDLMIDGIIWEVKSPRATTSSGIDQAMRLASRQAENVILDLGENPLTTEVKRGIKDRVSRSEGKRIMQVMVITKDEMRVFSRLEILDWQ